MGRKRAQDMTMMDAIAAKLDELNALVHELQQAGAKELEHAERQRAEIVALKRLLASKRDGKTAQ
jgi:Mg2+ and Co2+ transporter CorA